MSDDEDNFTVQNDEPLDFAGELAGNEDLLTPLVDEIEKSVYFGGLDEEEDTDTGDLENRVAELEDTVDELRDLIPIPPQYDNPFFANVETDGTWDEVRPQAATSSTLITGSTRSCMNATESCALITPATNQALICAVDVPGARKYVQVPTGSASSTITLGTITGHTGNLSSSGYTYNATMSGGTVTLYNTFDMNGLAVGTPGSLGVNVGNNGTVNGGTCVVQPLGNAVVVMTKLGSTWYCSCPNSAQ